MKKIWHGCNNGVKISAKLNGIKFEYFADTGDKETSGGGILLPRHFFKPKWQAYFKACFSEIDFSEICESIRAEYQVWQKDPRAYKR